MTESIEGSIRDGEELFAQGKVEEAKTFFLDLLKKEPDNADIFNNLGALHYASGQTEEAESYFSHALEADPNHEDALFNLSSLYQGARRWKEAAVQLERLLEKDKDNIELLNQLALIYLEADNREQAITALKQSLAIHPEQVEMGNVLNDLEISETSCEPDHPSSVEKKRSLKNGREEKKILHIMVLDKFLPSFMDFVDKHFGRTSHQYIFVDKEHYEYGLTPEHGAEFLQTIDGIFITLLESMKQADQIILHGLWRTEVDILLYFNQDLLKKCYWVMWGGDYYFPERRTAIRKQIIRNMGHVINYTIEDYELVKKWYGANAEHHKCFGYLSNTFKDYSYLKNEAEKNNGGKIILVGNSAHPTNNHFEILDKLSAFKSMNIEVICPLSYGDHAYAEQVICAGNTLLGNKFKPLVQFIPLEEYLKILLKVDMAIFAHGRQQGMGNIRTLLGMGKKIYMRDDITSWRSLKDIHVKVYSFNRDPIDFDFPEHLQRENIKHMKENFSYERLISDWDKIFNH